ATGCPARPTGFSRICPMRRWTLPGGCSTSISVSANACQQLIGVAAKEADLPWVAEFFELFKTPWELAVGGKHYRVLLSASDHSETFNADLTLVYGTKELELDRRVGAVVTTIGGPLDIQWSDETFPIYGRAATFSSQPYSGFLFVGSAAIDYRQTSGATTVHRIGYDLFEEVSYLLTQGQPKAYAETP